MLGRFKDEATSDIFNGVDSKKARKAHPADLTASARRKLARVDTASALDDLSVPPGNRLEALTGDRKGQHSIRINGRITKERNLREFTIPKNNPVTPGEILEEEFRKPLRLTQQQLADALGISRVRYAELASGKRGVTIDTAARLARVLGTSAQSWLNLQHVVDMYKLQKSETGKEIKKLRPLKMAAEGEPALVPEYASKTPRSW